MNVTFRMAEACDQEAVLQLWRQVFFEQNETYWQITADRLQAGLSTGCIAVKMMFDHQDLIGAVRYTFAHRYVGGKLLQKVHIGEVAVAPNLQGQGLGRCLMQESVAWLRRQPNIDFAELGGLYHFYSQFGFVPCCNVPIIRIPLNPESGGVKKISVDQIIDQLPDSATWHIRALKPETDREAVLKLQEPGGDSFLTPGDYGFEFCARKNAFDLCSLVICDDQNRLHGYLHGSSNYKSIYHFGAQSGSALTALMSEWLRRAYKNGQPPLVIGGGKLEFMTAALNTLSVGYEVVSAHGGYAGAMRLNFHSASRQGV